MADSSQRSNMVLRLALRRDSIMALCSSSVKEPGNRPDVRVFARSERPVRWATQDRWSRNVLVY